MPTKDSKTQTEEALQLTLKRKWQIALRRYLLENNPAVSYAPYFGLPAFDMKKWIEIQFTEGMTWENFGKVWNLTQRVPAQLFNLLDERELALCWNFINLTVQEIKEHHALATVQLFSTRPFFSALYESTQFEKCREMLDKITKVELIEPESIKSLELFIRENQQTLDVLRDLDGEDYSRLNRGVDLQLILMEKEIIKKYGS